MSAQTLNTRCMTLSSLVPFNAGDVCAMTLPLNAGSYVTHETKHFVYFYLGECPNKLPRAIIPLYLASDACGQASAKQSWCTHELHLLLQLVTCNMPGHLGIFFNFRFNLPTLERPLSHMGLRQSQWARTFKWNSGIIAGFCDYKIDTQ